MNERDRIKLIEQRSDKQKNILKNEFLCRVTLIFQRSDFFFFTYLVHYNQLKLETWLTSRLKCDACFLCITAVKHVETTNEDRKVGQERT